MKQCFTFQKFREVSTQDESMQTSERTITLTLKGGFKIEISCFDDDEYNKIAALITVQG